jgi:hypothetical protein
MKKIFLTLALVFATGTMINASSTSNTTNSKTIVEDWPTEACIGMAFDAGIEDYDTFDRVVSACEAM